MPSLYTNQERIARKLIGRLNINPSITTLPLQSIAGFGPSVTSQTVQPELLDDIINEKEAYITLVLAQFYKVPLRLTSPVTVNILGEITDGLVISRLLQIHYESSVSPISGSVDMGNASSDMKRQAELLLAAISASANVFHSVQPAPMQSGYGMVEITPLVLPEEIVLSRGQRPDLITRNYTEIAKNKVSEVNRKKFDFEQDICCSNSLDTF